MSDSQPRAILRYNFRLRPGATAKRYLLDEWDRCRWAWNEAISCDRDYRHYGAQLTGYDMKRELTKWRAARPWLAGGSAVAQQEMILNWGRARFRKGFRPPRFKSKRTALPSLDYTKSGFSLVEVDGRVRLRLPGKVCIPVVWSRDLPSKPTSARVYRDACGDWFVSFVVRAEVEPAPETGRSIGIDWGVSVTATTTDPAYDLPHAEHGQQAADKLAKYHRRMARRRPKPGQVGSKRYRKAQHQAAKQSRKVARKRKDDAVKWANRVVANHDEIAVENFRPKFLARSTMARKAADARIGACKRELVERGERAGRAVVLVPPAYTTMTCSECGARAKSRLPLHQRTFLCEHCGHAAGRDENAARTILAAAGFNGASAESVRQLGPPGSVAA